MKLMRLLGLCMVVILLLFGCSGTPIVYSDSYVFGQDSQYYFRPSTFCGMAETTSGLYFMSGPENDFLYYYDKKSKKAIPVCNKPNCLHADEPDPDKMGNAIRIWEWRQSA